MSVSLREMAARERDEVRALIRETEDKLRDLRDVLDRLDFFLDGHTERMDGLRGAALGRAARSVLAEVGEPMHYRAVYERVAAQHPVAGRDPLASTLTAMTRDPYIVRADGRAGVYAALALNTDGPEAKP